MNGTPVEKIIDIDKLVKQDWSPEERRDSRITSISQGEKPIIGGDFVVNGRSEAVTLAFGFKGPNGKNYGLTVFHNWEGCGDPVYAFLSNIPNPSTGKHPLKKIGTIVHFSEVTDSMIFEFLPDVMVELHKIKIGPTTKHDLLPALTKWSLIPLEIISGTKVCGFGAQRRGTVGIVHCRFGRNDHNVLLENDIGMIDSLGPGGVGKKMISHDGDCGMIYCDEQGIPLAMHHVLTGEGGEVGAPNTVYKSWGVPFKSVVASHHQYFGIDVSAQTASHQMTSLQSSSPRKGSVIVPGATPLDNVEFLPGEAPERKYVTIGSGATHFSNVEIVSDGRKPDDTEPDTGTDGYFYCN